MEVSDRPKQSGGDDENMTKASMVDDNTFTMVIYRKLVHFLMSLNSGGTFSHCLCLFLTSLNSTLKLLDIMVIDYPDFTIDNLFFQRLYCLLNCFIKLVRNEQYMFEKWVKTPIFYLNYVKSNLKVLFTSHFIISFELWFVGALEVLSPLIFTSWFREILWTILSAVWNR